MKSIGLFNLGKKKKTSIYHCQTDNYLPICVFLILVLRVMQKALDIRKYEFLGPLCGYSGLRCQT